MRFLTKMKNSAQRLPPLVWVSGLLIPGGFVAIGIYLAYKASKKEKPKQSFREFIDEMINEMEEPKDDSSKDSR